MGRADALVLGAGIVGVSTALALQERGIATILVDRQAPGLAASFGNSGVLQREAVMPYEMPRDVKTLFTTLIGKNTAARLHLSALPSLIPFLARYWWYSEKSRHHEIAKSYATLIERCLEAYAELSTGTNASSLMTNSGIVAGFRSRHSFATAQKAADYAAATYGVEYTALESDTAIREVIPHINSGFEAAIHYKDSVTVSDPHALLTELFNKFENLGGQFANADAMALRLEGDVYSLIGNGNDIQASHAVIALGAHSPILAQKFGLKVPMGLKRGYHLHFAQDPKAPLTATFADEHYGYVLTPKVAGIRLTTGAEFAKPNVAPTPHQLEQVMPIAHKLHPLGAQIEEKPWMGIRPCMPDMLPVIGETPGQKNLWCAFGHGHQGLTLGPITGQLIADLITARPPKVNLEPFYPGRFTR
ncbi:MAG: NAD(P)/FAD-dependent oxidoreductase [Hyphomicrobiales bacterium]